MQKNNVAKIKEKGKDENEKNKKRSTIGVDLDGADQRWRTKIQFYLFRVCSDSGNYIYKRWLYGRCIWHCFGIVCWLLNTISTSLRYKEFQIQNKIPYPDLITELIPVLLPLGMMIEKSSDKGGSPVISYQGVIYDVTYDETKDVFTIWWRVNVARAFLKVDYIGRYRKIVAAMGIIGYHVQQICNRPAPAFTQNATDGNIENAEVEDKKFCTRCGAALAKGAKFCPGCGSAVNN